MGKTKKKETKKKETKKKEAKDRTDRLSGSHSFMPITDHAPTTTRTPTSTLSPSPTLIPTPGSSTPRSPPGYHRLDNSSSGPSHVGASSSAGAASSTNVGVGPSTEHDTRQWISPSFTYKNEFQENSWKVIRAIGETICRKWEGGYHSYKDVPKTLRDTFFREFQLKYRWATAHDYMIRKIFDHVGSKSISDKFRYYRMMNQKPDFVNDQDYKLLQAYWSSPEFLNKSIKNKRNRASDCGGEGPANHTGGSIPRSEHGRRMAERGEVVTQAKLFMHTHSQYDVNGQRLKWVDERAGRTYKNFEEKLASIQTSETGETIPISPDVELKTWADTVGIGKKGNIYGLGSEAARVRPSSSSHFRPSSSVDPELSSRIQTLEQTVQEKIQQEQQFKDKLAKTEELYDAAQERLGKLEHLVEGLLRKRKKSKPPMYPAKKQQLSESESESESDEDDEESSD